MRIVPITLKRANEFVAEHHRHNKPVRGHKFSVGLENSSGLVGVAIGGRPISRVLDDGYTLEITRVCTTGERNANSMLYGAMWRAAKAMGYWRCVTYIQADEGGASLRAAGWIKSEDLPARGSWAESSGSSTVKRDPVGNGGVDRERWSISVTPKVDKPSEEG